MQSTPGFKADETEMEPSILWGDIGASSSKNTGEYRKINIEIDKTRVSTVKIESRECSL